MSLPLRVSFLLLAFVAPAAAGQVYVPEDLEDWREWVLKDQEYRDCPFYFDRRAAARGDFVCAWPGRLQLDVGATGGRFEQQWTLHAEQQWITLPGSIEYWPEQVTVNDRPVEVMARNNQPSIRLAPGTYRVEGRFGWDQRPGLLRIPAQSGLLSLSIDGRAVARPDVRGDSVFLAARDGETAVADSLRVLVHRLVADDVPLRLSTQLRIDVSGSVREEVLGPLLPEGFVPLSLHSRLPVRLESDGKLRLQVRPGNWIVQLEARAPGVPDAVARPQHDDGLPDDEIWSYRGNDRLRVTVAEGAVPVDPAQAEVPRDWANLPAFRVARGEGIRISERSRGATLEGNQLTLNRVMWLDFDGDGYVVQDDVGGTMRSAWRLDMAGPFSLLSATEEGDSLLITEGAEGRTGVELRRTAVALNALGRSDTRGAMPVTGWDERFVSVRAALNLPPGHKLLAAPGVDRALGSWIHEWQLLDFFLLLIITIAVWRLFNPVAGCVALLALTLSFHEPFAPTWLWLNLLVAIALLRVAPPGRLRTAVRVYQLASAAVLLLALLPFVAGQLRVAIYPQLEPQASHHAVLERGRVSAYDQEAMVESRVVEEVMAVARQQADAKSVASPGLVSAPREFARYAPNTVLQAGAGIPAWRWNTHVLEWSGPVDETQQMRLVVLGRWAVTLWRTVDVLLLLLLATVLAAEIAGRRWNLPGGFSVGGGKTAGKAAGAAAAVVAVAFLAAAPEAQAELPSEELLQQLQQRLLEPPDCIPRCAEIAMASVSVDGDAIGMRLGIHAMEAVAIPLPGSSQGWRVDAALVDGGSNARIVRGADASLWLWVPAGTHEVTLRGKTPAVDSVEIPFPAPPRVIEVQSDGWLVTGIKDRRLLSGSLQLERLRDAGDTDIARWESSRFPAFAEIERTVAMSVDWQVTTTVERVAPAAGALTLEVPLLPGESIVSGEFEVAAGHVLVSMRPQQRNVSWTSTLPMESPLQLAAADGAPWKETWNFVIGNIWNAEFDGVPESNSGDTAEGLRVASFDPRGGEQLTMTASRPEAIAGSTLAFDAARLDVQHGARSSDVKLSLEYRSTRGARHVIGLPDGAELTGVSIDGKAQTLRAEDGRLTLPIQPGAHSVVIDWRSAGAMGLRTTTPLVDVGAPVSNINLSFTRPHDRWLLGTTGPKLGPAVLYWPELAVLVLFAFILGRIGLAPLGMPQWLLLGLGFSTFNWPVFGLVAAWLLAFGIRERWQSSLTGTWFNAMQVVSGALTVFALLAIVVALPQGLLGTPDMHVAGQNSWGNVLGWFADSSETLLPVASVFTLPLWTYKLLILAWALWLSFALLRWLPWVWRCFSSEGLWFSPRDGDKEDK